jgi:hypothetical protein
VISNANLRRRAGITPEQQALALGVSLDGLAWLCMCWWPRTDRRAEDMAKIVDHVGMEPAALVELLGIKDAPEESGES